MEEILLGYDQFSGNDVRYEAMVNIDGNDFYQNSIYSMNTSKKLFNDTFSIGNTACGEIAIEMAFPSVSFGKMAKIIPKFRATKEENGKKYVSEWKQKGVYYIDTRERVIVDSMLALDDSNDRLKISGFDGMLKFSKEYCERGSEKDFADGVSLYDIVMDIVKMANEDVNTDSGLEQMIESATLEILKSSTKLIKVKPVDYTGRETLGFVAAILGGCFSMDDFGKLKFIEMDKLLT